MNLGRYVCGSIWGFDALDGNEWSFAIGVSEGQLEGTGSCGGLLTVSHFGNLVPAISVRSCQRQSVLSPCIVVSRLGFSVDKLHRKQEGVVCLSSWSTRGWRMRHVEVWVYNGVNRVVVRVERLPSGGFIFVVGLCGSSRCCFCCRVSVVGTSTCASSCTAGGVTG